MDDMFDCFDKNTLIKLHSLLNDRIYKNVRVMMDDVLYSENPKHDEEYVFGEYDVINFIMYRIEESLRRKLDERKYAP